MGGQVRGIWESVWFRLPDLMVEFRQGAEEWLRLESCSAPGRYALAKVWH